jgi:hypothetical protein
LILPHLNPLPEAEEGEERQMRRQSTRARYLMKSCKGVCLQPQTNGRI